MKKIIHYILYSASFLLAAFTLPSCKKTLENLNQNPNNPITIPPGALLTSTELYTTKQTDRRTSISFGMMFVQQTASLLTDDQEGDKYLPAPSNAPGLFDYTYQTLAPLIYSMLSLTGNQPQYKNMDAMGRIMRVLIFQRVTDMYGDIPYSQAGQGYSAQVFSPVYDKQPDIYHSMLNQLDSAANELNPAADKVGAADVMYNGDVAKWKKLAYSLMLRLALRMSNVDASTAQQWITKAVNGGVILSNADNAYIQHTNEYNDNANAISYSFQKFILVTAGDIKISTTFLNYMRQTNDPRTGVYFSLPDGDTKPADQVALPNGYDATTIKTYSAAPLSAYSTFSTEYILPLQTPTFFVTAAEVQLMLAEAAVRGWTPGDAAGYYSNAVQASMDQQSLYGASVSAEQTTAYLAANPFPSDQSDQLKAIGYQYWVATYLDGFESYSNWRRTGYPALTPVNYPGNATNGIIPRRIVYPQSEYVTNKTNINAANQDQGADNYTTHVWWDKQ